ncbi:helix-turn-helix transcriptional regulator [Fluviicola sp.]|uniref:helix-turn-helix domain-containing protein n=1 Tax=Fluviicola sp. TaxID=1917219 RepID=UPI0031CEC99B
MAKASPLRIKTIGEFHKLRGLPAPEHPLISLVDYAQTKRSPGEGTSGLVFDFYLVSVKRGMAGRMSYGQQEYDFDGNHNERVMFFMSPGQLLKLDAATHDPGKRSGWMLLIHPDFLWNTSLAKNIGRYEYFDYKVNEALFLFEKEEAVLRSIVENIRQEYQGNIDSFSQSIMVSQIETLLNYSERFYQRQFITRKKSSHQVLEQMESLLDAYFDTDTVSEKGLPAVHDIADQLHVSVSYLGSLLKSLTGMNTQQHIHEKLIQKAKEKLSTTRLSVGEIAYELGFEHSQSFSKLFKNKTSMSPLEFRNSFN